MAFQIREPIKVKLVPVMVRFRPVTIGQVRKIAFSNNLSVQELVNQMVEHCLGELTNDGDAGQR